LARNILGSNAAFLLFFTSTIFPYEVSQVSRSYSDSDAQNSNRAGVTLPRFTSQIFTTAARGYSNFNNLRKAAAGRVVILLWTGNLGEQF
jgi:hypothetical protein